MTDNNPIMGIKTKACVNGVYPDTIPTIQQNIANIEDDIDDINTELDNVVHKTGDEEIGGQKTFIEDITTSGGTDSMVISDNGSITFNKVIDGVTLSSVSGFEYDEDQEQGYMYAPSFTPVDQNDDPIVPYDGVVLTSKNLDVDPRITSLGDRVTALEQSGSSSNGYTAIPKQYISQVKSQIVEYNEEIGIYIAKTNMYVCINITPDTFYIPILKNEYISGNRTIITTSGSGTTERSIDEYAFILNLIFDDELTSLPYSLNRIILNTSGTINIQHQESSFDTNRFMLVCENIDFNPNN